MVADTSGNHNTGFKGMLTALLSRLGLKRWFKVDGLELTPSPGPEYHKVSWKIRHGKYERTEIDLARACINPDLPLIEFGAGIGVSSCYLNRCLNEPRRHWAYEMDPAVGAINRMNRDRNNLSYELVEEAVATGRDTVGFTPGATWLSNRVTQDGEITATGLARALERAGDGPVNLFMDIEGEESAVIKDRGELMRERVAVAIIEFHPKVYGAYHAAELMTHLMGFGFDMVASRSNVAVFLNRALTVTSQALPA